MDNRYLPPRPSLVQLRHEAKDVLKAVRSGSIDALVRLREAAPRLREHEPSLADAQLVLAGEYGFSSWPKLKGLVDGLHRVAERITFLRQAFAYADQPARVLLVDGHRPSQLPYLAALPGRFHDDLVLHQIQQHIGAHPDESFWIGKLAAQFGLSSGTLSRRFIGATGHGQQPTGLPATRPRPAGEAPARDDERPDRGDPPSSRLPRPRRLPSGVQADHRPQPH